MTDLSTEDKKLVTLARATRARIQAAEGAAVRDTAGSTKAAPPGDHPAQQLSARHGGLAVARRRTQ